MASTAAAGSGNLPHHCKVLSGPELICFLLQVALLKHLASMGSMQAEARRIIARMADKLLEVALTEQTVTVSCHLLQSVVSFGGKGSGCKCRPCGVVTDGCRAGQAVSLAEQTVGPMLRVCSPALMLTSQLDLLGLGLTQEPVGIRLVPDVAECGM